MEGNASPPRPELLLRAGEARQYLEYWRGTTKHRQCNRESLLPQAGPPRPAPPRPDSHTPTAQPLTSPTPRPSPVYHPAPNDPTIPTALPHQTTLHPPPWYTLSPCHFPTPRPPPVYPEAPNNPPLFSALPHPTALASPLHPSPCYTQPPTTQYPTNTQPPRYTHSTITHHNPYISLPLIPRNTHTPSLKQPSSYIPTLLTTPPRPPFSPPTGKPYTPPIHHLNHTHPST